MTLDIGPSLHIKELYVILKGKAGFNYGEKMRGLKWPHRHPMWMSLKALSDLGEWAMALSKNKLRFF